MSRADRQMRVDAIRVFLSETGFDPFNGETMRVHAARKEAHFYWEFLRGRYAEMSNNTELEETLRRNMAEAAQKAMHSHFHRVFVLTLAAKHVEKAENIPLEISQVAVMQLLGNLPSLKPKPPGGWDLFPRDIMIYMAVNKCRELGSPSLQDAFDEIAEVLRQTRKRPTNPETVKKLYLKTRRFIVGADQADA